MWHATFRHDLAGLSRLQDLSFGVIHVWRPGLGSCSSRMCGGLMIRHDLTEGPARSNCSCACCLPGDLTNLCGRDACVGCIQRILKSTGGWIVRLVSLRIRRKLVCQTLIDSGKATQNEKMTEESPIQSRLSPTGVAKRNELPVSMRPPFDLGGVPREQKMLKGYLPRVMYHQVS